MSEKWAIVEDPDSENGLPDHWSDVNLEGVDYRVMKTLDSKEEAEEYIERNYGMYSKHAKVVEI